MPAHTEELSIRDLNHTGQGVGVGPGGVATFVTGALVGERVRVAITQNKKNHRVGQLLQVLEPSPQRAAPFCEAYGRCGGCQLQHLDYPGQLTWKARYLKETLRRLGGLEAGDVVVLSGRDRDCRATLRLVAQPGEHTLRLGFFEARSHQLAPIAACPVSAPPLGRALDWLHQLAAQNVGALAGLSAVGLRCNTAGEVVVLLSGEVRLDEKIFPPPPPIVGVALCDKPKGNRLFAEHWRTTWGHPRLTENRLGFEGLRLSPGSFMQAHPAVHDLFLRWLEDFARTQPPGAVADLFAGTGLSSLVFVRAGHRVVSVESGRSSHEDAVVNLRHAKQGETETGSQALAVRALAEDWLADQSPGGFAGVFLNPPRKGLLPGGAAALAALGPQWIVYQSCNAASLARDTGALAQTGYGLTHTLLLDFFPHTAHLEAVVVMEKHRSHPC